MLTVSERSSLREFATSSVQSIQIRISAKNRPPF
jgi:hypothetical protein